MGKLDEVKEILNTLRVATSISFGILMMAVTGLIKRFDANNIDVLFWAGVVFSVFIIIIIFK
ncbi:MAG: hypothetical protein QM500_10115, partial [Methylococcales bacterium]